MDIASFFLGFVSAFVFIGGVVILIAILWLAGFAKYKSEVLKSKPMKVSKRKISVTVDNEKL